MQLIQSIQLIFIVVLSGHQCEKSGCGSVLVVDGNMKKRTCCLWCEECWPINI